VRKLEEQAAEQGVRVIWKVSNQYILFNEKSLISILLDATQGAKLEVEGVIRNVCDEVLNDKNVNARTRDLRATALKLMGEVCILSLRVDFRAYADALLTRHQAFISIKKPGEEEPAKPPSVAH